jgi:hypothetical protein
MMSQRMGASPSDDGTTERSLHRPVHRGNITVATQQPKNFVGNETTSALGVQDIRDFVLSE